MVRGVTYALWDRTSDHYLSWSWQSMKRVREEISGYINHHKISVIKVINSKVVAEVNRDSGKPVRVQKVDLALAQRKLY